MNRHFADDLGRLLLRGSLGVLILLHGIAKLTGGTAGIQKLLAGVGLPGTLAFGVYVGEVIAPLMLIAGWYARIGAALIAVNMLFAIFLVHGGELLALGRQGGWALELQGMFLFTALALALMSPGRFSVNGR